MEALPPRIPIVRPPGPGPFFGLPYEILVPQGWSNLWVAGRCASSDVQVHGSIRVQPACAMMGQAVGTAAAQSVRTAQRAYDLDVSQLVQTLQHAGAFCRRYWRVERRR